MLQPITPSPSHDVTEKDVVLLGLIAEGPSHAYGLEEKIRDRLMNQWADIATSSIYRVLSQLEDRGLVDSHLEHEGQGATRKVYSINAAGRAVLARGVLSRLGHVAPLKNPFQVALAFVTHAPLHEVVTRLQERLHELHRCQERTSQGCFPLEKERRPHPCAPPSQPANDDNVCRRLVLDYVHRHIEAEEAFVTQALRSLQSVNPSLFEAQALTQHDSHLDKEVAK